MGLRNVIHTRDKEIFTKLNALYFTDEILINKSKKKNITQALVNINKKDKILERYDIGDKIMLRRIKPFNMNVRYRKR